MDDRRFDALTRAMAQGSSRRTAIKGLFAGVLGGAALARTLAPASAQTSCEIDDDCDGCSNCVEGACVSSCDGFCCDGVCAQECCSAENCDPSFAYYCGTPVCDDGICTSTPNCGTDQRCCNPGTPEHYCAQCCNDDQCPGCQVCNANGVCEPQECCTSEDCPTPPDNCSIYSCEDGTCVLGAVCGTDQICCLGSCIAPGACCTADNCEAGEHCCEGDGGANYCAECCDDRNCEACETCFNGTCIDRGGGICCDGVWIVEGQCCASQDCIEPTATTCTIPTCVEHQCVAEPGCPPNHFCCGEGTEGAHCEFCCDDDQCEGDFGYCQDGHCHLGECRIDSDCGECSACEGHHCFQVACLTGYACCGGTECVPEDECCRSAGETCGVVDVTSAGGATPGQYDCCDGLLCCFGQSTNICAKCCSDSDCGPGGTCDNWVCHYPAECKHDHDCPKGTCCCHNGDCSEACCPKPPKPPKPPRPPKPPKPAPSGGGSVSTLPATGSGEASDGSSLFGAVALGAAALLAAKKLRDDQATAAPPVEE